MANVVEIIIRATDAATRQVKGVSAALSSLNKTSASATQSIRAQSAGLRDLASSAQQAGTVIAGTGLAMTAFFAVAVNAAARIDSLKRGLIAVSGSAQAAERQFERLVEVAKLPGLGLEEAIEGSIRLQAAGFSAQTAERALKAFGNALATVGGTPAELQGVIVALTQIAAKGKVSAEEINQIAERVPQIRRVMQVAFGTADTERIAKSGISSRRFVEVLVRELEKLPPATGGIANAFINLRDELRQTFAAIGEALLPAVGAITQFLSPMLARFRDFAKTPFGKTVIIIAAALSILLVIVGGVIAALAALAGAVLTITAGWAVLAAALPVIGAALAALALPIGIVIAVLIVLGGLIFLIVRNWSRLTAFFSNLWSAVKRTFFAALAAITSAFTSAFQRFRSILQALESQTKKMSQRLGKVGKRVGGERGAAIGKSLGDMLTPELFLVPFLHGLSPLVLSRLAEALWQGTRTPVGRRPGANVEVQRSRRQLTFNVSADGDIRTMTRGLATR